MLLVGGSALAWNLRRVDLRSFQTWCWVALLAIVTTQTLRICADASILEFAPPLVFSVSRPHSVMVLGGWAIVAALCLGDPVTRNQALWWAGVVAILGIAQFHTGASGFYWAIPFKTRFFSVFSYVNNSGSFFILASGLAMTYKLRGIPLVMLFYYCAYLTQCRFAMAVIPILPLYALLTRRWRVWGLLGIAVTGFVALALKLDYLLSVGRWQEYEAFYHFSPHFPWFGAGPWGYHWFANTYGPEWLHALFVRNPNCHNSYLMFFYEYGVIGASLLGCLATKLLCRRVSVLTLAIILVSLHGFIDMPWHCPAVVALAVIMAKLESTTDLTEGLGDST